MHPDFAGRVGEHPVPICQFYTKHRVGQVLFNRAFNFNGLPFSPLAAGWLSPPKRCAQSKNNILRNLDSYGIVSTSARPVRDRERVLEVGGEASRRGCARSSCRGRASCASRPCSPSARWRSPCPVASTGAGLGRAVVRYLRVLVHLAGRRRGRRTRARPTKPSPSTYAWIAAPISPMRAPPRAARDAALERLARHVDQPLRLGSIRCRRRPSRPCRRRTPCTCSRCRC